MKAIYGLIETKQEAIEQYGLADINDEAVARIITANNQERALERVNNLTGENAFMLLMLATYDLKTFL